MRLLVVSVRVAGRPTETYTHYLNAARKHPGYRAGLYALETSRTGHQYFILVGDIIRQGSPKKSFVNKKSAIQQAKQLCEDHKEQYIYQEGIKNYTRIKSLPNCDDLLTLIDFYDAIE